MHKTFKILYNTLFRKQYRHRAGKAKIACVKLRLLAHLSRRLMGELISVPVTQASVDRPSFRPQFQTSSPLKPLGQLNSNFIWRLLRTWKRKFVSYGPGHMTKMAATPIYGKNPLKIFFSRTRRPMTLGLGI